MTFEKFCSSRKIILILVGINCLVYFRTRDLLAKTDEFLAEVGVIFTVNKFFLLGTLNLVDIGINAV